ncbi:MAG: hypothetical protein DWQ07_04305 [Chloroflexi bacterium]|nr:MAG: hypothetical protein DWQ07_04305 [Chloroflexota bacterium]MBL1194655.1 hypothetical protein [Chloroflexota bacterium]NOH11945.1 hypothetical protein [Chloroflexota bacterium]
MRVPVIQGLIDRRILVNYRVDPGALVGVLPPPFEPKIIGGYGIAGICLIRLKDIRPNWLPVSIGLSSENAAHRIAVRWKAKGEWHEGVYIPRRDTDSRLNTLVGGRLFPGIHYHAHFDVQETGEDFRVALKSVDDNTSMNVHAKLSTQLPTSTIFGSLEAVSAFFEAGAMGYSPAHHEGNYDGLELRTFNWYVQPLQVEQVSSSFFEDEDIFPTGSISFDNALLMRGIEHQWHEHETLCV